MNRFGAYVLVLAGLFVAVVGSAGAAGAAPIPSTGEVPSLPAIQGGAVKASPVPGAARSPQNPHLAKNPFSNIHNDTWMTDAYPGRGPLGSSSDTSSGAAQLGICGSLAFDSLGRIVTICPSTLNAPQARIIDPDSLEVIATYELPDAPTLSGTANYQNFAGGGYFFLDPRDRIWVITKTNHLFVLGQTPDGSDFRLRRDFDLTSRLNVDRERVTSALPDFQGRIWFVAKQTGKVGTFDRRTRAIRILKLGEEIQNSFTVGENGVFIVTDRRLYRFKADRRGKPKITWKTRYRSTGEVKPGQVDAGSGTTPTVLKGGYVAIGDNADPMNVVVYRTRPRLRGNKRLVCEVPVFEKGRSGTENALIGTGRSLIVENNYGYIDPFGPDGASVVTEPGFARVDIKKNGKGCRKVWTNREVRGASAVPKISTRNGLIYTYTRPPDASGAQGYYWTAIKFRNGRTAWNRYAGSGFGFNNNYAGLALGPDGSAYIGVIGGIASLRDG